MKMDTIGTRIRARRTELGLSQQALASKAGVTQGLIGQIEAGINKGSKHAIAIARALAVSPDWLEEGGQLFDMQAGREVAVFQAQQSPEIQWIIATWQAASVEAKEVARFALSKPTDPLPPWVDRELLDRMDSIRYKALLWLRDRPEQTQT